MKIPIAVAYGDGIGPEIMEATLQILHAAGAQIEPHPIEIGEKVYLRGFTPVLFHRLGNFPLVEGVSESADHNTSRWRI